MRMKERIYCVIFALTIILSAVSPLSVSHRHQGRGDGNESFATAQEIPTDGTVTSDSVNFNTDMVDFFKFHISPNQGECVNTTITLRATTPATFVYMGIYTADRFLFLGGGAAGGGQEVKCHFWAPTEDYYYLSLATENAVNSAYQVNVSLQNVVQIPDGNNNITEAPEVTGGNTYKERVNRTTDCYDIYKIQVNANETHGEGLNVRLNNFTDVNVAVYDPLKVRRADSNTFMSGDPNKGETVRFVANQTGYYYIVITFEFFMPQGDYALYDLTVNVTPDLSRDEDWSMEKASYVALGIHNGTFDSSFDEFDYFKINLTQDDELNVSILVTEPGDWDASIEIYDENGDDLADTHHSSPEYVYTGIKVPEDGTYIIEFTNEDLTVFNYTYLLTIDGKNFGNVRPVALNATSANFSTAEDTPGNFDLTTVFKGGEPRTFICSSNGSRNESNITIDIDQTGIAAITPAENWAGNTTAIFHCRDYFNFTKIFSLNISVTPVNDGPVFDDIGGVLTPDVFWLFPEEEKTYDITFNVSDVDNSTDELNISVSSESSRLFYNSTEGLLHYYSDDGTLHIETFDVMVSDGLLNDTQTIKVDITDLNDPPVAQPIRLVSGGNESLTVVLETDAAYDEEGVSLTYLWSFGDGNDSIGFDMLSVTHTYAEAGIYMVRLEVNDSEFVDISSIEINVTAPPYQEEPPEPVDPVWYSNLDEQPVGDNISLAIEILSAQVTDVELEKRIFLSTINSTYVISGTCGNGVEIIYLYYGVEESSNITWKPIDDVEGIVTPDNGTWSLDLTTRLEISFFEGVDRMGILAMAWGKYDYNLDTMDADYTFVELVEEEFDPSLWKNLTKSYTDDEKDEMYRHMKINSYDYFTEEMDVEPISATFGERPDLDIIKLSSRLEGSTFHVDLTTRGPPTDYDMFSYNPLDDTEEWLLREEVAYYVYLVSPDFNESGYSVEDALYGQTSDEIDSVLDNGFLAYPLGFFGSPEIEGNTISWEVSLDTLVMLGLEPSTDFELFAFAYLQQTVEVYEEFASGYDSAGYGAFSPDTSSGIVAKNGGGGGESSDSKMGTGVMILGAVGVVVIIAVIIIVVIIVNKNKKKSAEPTPTAPSIELEPPSSPQEKVKKLIDEAESLGMQVSGYKDDVEMAKEYLKGDEAGLNTSLTNLSTRIQMDIDRKKEESGISIQEEMGTEKDGSTTAGIATPSTDKTPLHSPPQTPVCPTCGQISVYYPEYECFWCDNCQDYVYPEEEQTPSPAIEQPAVTGGAGINQQPGLPLQPQYPPPS